MRLVRALVGAFILVLALGGQVLADGGPHGSYTDTTDGCAACHRTHSASAPGLLVNSNTALCLTCHGPAATGAETNVSDGIYEGTAMGAQNAGLNGGGFSHAVQNTDLGSAPTSGATTSMHDVQGLPGYSSTAVMWGAGTDGSGSTFDLYCTSCHDPHGNDNYRMLKPTVNGVAVAVAQTDEAVKDYTAPRYYKPEAASGQWEISGFCSACHTRYMSGLAGSGGGSSGDTSFPYRHRVDAPSGSVVNGVTYSFPPLMSLPVSSVDGGILAASPDNRSMMCLTCHYAHGSKAEMGTNSGAVPWPGGSTTPDGSARSSLLRLDNRGVCQDCHQR